MNAPRPTMRLDKWLWHARLFRTRGLANRVIGEGRVRVNAARADKAARPVGAGDTLTFTQGGVARVVRIVALGTRRGPAPEARALYEDVTPPVPCPPADRPAAVAGGRPTGRARRVFEQSRRRWLDPS